MVKKGSTHPGSVSLHRYHSPNVPLAAIQRYARRIAERFKPQRIILFGSYAYGAPDANSDVDLLVVMAASNHISQAIRICLAVEPPFPLDLIVRTPQKLRQGLEDENSFLREIVEKGKVLYEKRDRALGTKGRIRPASRATTRPRQTALSR